MYRINKIILSIALLFSALIVAAQISSKQISYSEFSFAQFTDTHIIDGDDSKSNNLLTAVNEVNDNAHIAFVVVTGDITHNGDLKSLIEAKRILDKLNCPYYVIPGNHDTRMTAQGGTEFKKVFGDDKFRILFNGFLFVGFNSSPIFDNVNGNIAPQDIVWVKRQLKNVGKKTPAILFTHHPLKTGDVNNWYDLTDVVRRYNIQTVIGGHYHRNMLNSYDNIPGVLTLATQQNKQNLGGYTIYEFKGDSILINEKIIGDTASTKWASLPIEYKVYLEGNTKDFPRPNYSINTKYSVKETWNKKIDNAIYSAPVANETNIFFGDSKGVIYSYSLKNGKPNWEYQISSRVISSPAIFENRVIFSSCDNNIYCFEATTGKLLWKKSAKFNVYDNPIIKNGVVYIKSLNDKYYSFDINSGEILEEVSFNENLVETSIDDLISTSGNGDIICKNTSGEIIWQYKLGNSIVSKPLKLTDTDYIITTEGGRIVHLSIK